MLSHVDLTWPYNSWDVPFWHSHICPLWPWMSLLMFVGVFQSSIPIRRHGRCSGQMQRWSLTPFHTIPYGTASFSTSSQDSTMFPNFASITKPPWVHALAECNYSEKPVAVCNSCFKGRNGISKAPTYHGRSWYVIKTIKSQRMSEQLPMRNFGSYCCPATNHKARIELQTLGRDKDQLNKMNTSDSSFKDRKKAMLMILYNTEHCEKKCRIETHWVSSSASVTYRCDKNQQNVTMS